jgi:hypothetical protein
LHQGYFARARAELRAHLGWLEPPSHQRGWQAFGDFGLPELNSRHLEFKLRFAGVNNGSPAVAGRAVDQAGRTQLAVARAQRLPKRLGIELPVTHLARIPWPSTEVRRAEANRSGDRHNPQNVGPYEFAVTVWLHRFECKEGGRYRRSRVLCVHVPRSALQRKNSPSDAPSTHVLHTPRLTFNCPSALQAADAKPCPPDTHKPCRTCTTSAGAASAPRAAGPERLQTFAYGNSVELRGASAGCVQFEKFRGRESLFQRKTSGSQSPGHQVPPSRRIRFHLVNALSISP